MYPKSNTCNVTDCLESLLGVRSKCSGGEDCFPFYVEDLPGVDIKVLSRMAKGSNLKGVDFAQELINTSARQMKADIELLANSGYAMQNIVGETCSTCTHLPSYTPDGGIVIRSVVNSRFQELRVTKLMVLTNITATKDISIDDGTTVKLYPVNLTAGVITPVNLPYKTNAKSVKIKFADATVPVGQIYCATSSTCGCGGSSKPNNNTIQITGLLAGVETSVQYGFLPCASVVCSYDSLVCSMIKNTPNIFGLSLFYKFGQNYYLNRNASDRNNEAVSLNESDETAAPVDYGKLYWWTIQGGNGKKAVKTIISQFLKTNRDRCVICDSKISTGHATG